MFIPKLIALDLDGTLLNSQGKVSVRTVRALEALKSMGARVVICTGRPPRHIETLAKELELTQLVIAYNGAVIVDFDSGKLSYRHQLERTLALEVIERVRLTHPGTMTGIETHHGWYLDQKLYELRLPLLQARNLTPPDGYGDASSFVQDTVIKVLFRHPHLTSSQMAQALEGLPVYATWSSPSLLEVMAEHVNKQEALAYLCDKFSLSSAEVATFGDQNNDKEMLAWAGCGVAVGNASDEAKMAADLVTSTNDEDGVAEVLERWI